MFDEDTEFDFVADDDGAVDDPKGHAGVKRGLMEDDEDDEDVLYPSKKIYIRGGDTQATTMILQLRSSLEEKQQEVDKLQANLNEVNGEVDRWRSIFRTTPLHAPLAKEEGAPGGVAAGSTATAAGATVGAVVPAGPGPGPGPGPGTKPGIGAGTGKAGTGAGTRTPGTGTETGTASGTPAASAVSGGGGGGGATPDPARAQRALLKLQASEQKLKEYIVQSKKKEYALLMRLSKKEQEIFELRTHVRDLMATDRPFARQTRKLLLDPVLYYEYSHLKTQLETFQKKLKDAQEDLAAIQFTPQSMYGNKLLAKCRMLVDKNDEIGLETSEGKVQDLEKRLEVQRQLNVELKGFYLELQEYVDEINDEAEKLQHDLCVVERELQQRHLELQDSRRPTETTPNGASDERRDDECQARSTAEACRDMDTLMRKMCDDDELEEEGGGGGEGGEEEEEVGDGKRNFDECEEEEGEEGQQEGKEQQEEKEEEGQNETDTRGKEEERGEGEEQEDKEVKEAGGEEDREEELGANLNSSVGEEERHSDCNGNRQNVKEGGEEGEEKEEEKATEGEDEIGKEGSHTQQQDDDLVEGSKGEKEGEMEVEEQDNMPVLSEEERSSSPDTPVT